MQKLLRSTLLLLTLQTLSGLVAAAELPTLGSPSHIGGVPTTAAFFAGATTDNGITYKSTFTATELVDITARIRVESAHINIVGNLYVVVSFGGQLYNQVVGGAFQPWNGALGTLLPVVANKVLAANENLTIVNKLAFGSAGVGSGTLSFFLGYGTGGTIGFYSGAPLNVTIQPAVDQTAAAFTLFNNTVSTPIILGNCIACHQTSGSASTSKLVYKASSVSGFQQSNFDVLKNYILNVPNGSSWILSKPQGGGLPWWWCAAALFLQLVYRLEQFCPGSAAHQQQRSGQCQPGHPEFSGYDG